MVLDNCTDQVTQSYDIEFLCGGFDSVREMTRPFVATDTSSEKPSTCAALLAVPTPVLLTAATYNKAFSTILEANHTH